MENGGLRRRIKKNCHAELVSASVYKIFASVQDIVNAICMQKHPASFILFPELAEGKCNEHGMQCSKAMCGSTGMEAEKAAKKHLRGANPAA